MGTGHTLNIAGWVCVVATLGAFAAFGKIAFLGMLLAMPLFALSLTMYNRAARRASTAIVDLERR